jgi:hypothetical protein
MDIIVGLACSALIWVAWTDSILQVGDPTSMYLAIVTASAALGTLAITPIAIVLALTPGPRLKALLAHHIALVRTAMAWTVLSNLCAVAVALTGLVIDSETDALSWLRATAFALELAALCAMGRLVWFFTALLTVDELDRTASRDTHIDDSTGD